MLCRAVVLATVCFSAIPAAWAEDPRAVEEGFVSLFDGESLDGWRGAIDGYYVEDGRIICKPETGGNLLTEREYADFVIRFEFKLTPGANNGLGIRLPEQGHPSFDGIELQILDDTADQYRDLQPWQYHGSVYGVVPARRGHLRPVGEWNEQEVIAQGPHIRVILNGETIIDANLAEVAPADGTEHPGIQRESGYLGFLGHGSRVELRNIRIKELNGG